MNNSEPSVEEINAEFIGKCGKWECHFIDDDNHFCEAKYLNAISRIQMNMTKMSLDTGYGIQFPPADNECLKKLTVLIDLTTELSAYVKKHDLMVKKSRGLDENGYTIDNET